MNLYSVLELNNTANISQIKQSYKKLALKYHPDKNKDINASEKFHSISLAYEILSDAEQKYKYDSMNEKKKESIFDIVSNLYSMFKNSDIKSQIYQNIIEDDEGKNILISGNTDEITKYLFNKANKYILNIIFR